MTAAVIIALWFASLGIGMAVAWYAGRRHERRTWWHAEYLWPVAGTRPSHVRTVAAPRPYDGGDAA